MTSERFHRGSPHAPSPLPLPMPRGEGTQGVPGEESSGDSPQLVAGDFTCHVTGGL